MFKSVTIESFKYLNDLSVTLQLLQYDIFKDSTYESFKYLNDLSVIFLLQPYIFSFLTLESDK